MSLELVISGPVQASAELVSLKPDLRLPSWLSVESLWLEEHQPHLVFDARVEWREQSQGYDLVHLTIALRDGGRVGAIDLRSVSVPEIVSAVVRMAMPTEIQRTLGRGERSMYLALRGGRITDELLLVVARRAATAQALQGNPNREVMECFDVPQRTASHWIARAREAGLLS